MNELRARIEATYIDPVTKSLLLEMADHIRRLEEAVFEQGPEQTIKPYVDDSTAL